MVDGWGGGARHSVSSSSSSAHPPTIVVTVREHPPANDYTTTVSACRLYNSVRWLSKGFVLQRFFAILDEIKLFLSSSDQLCAKDYLDFLEIKEHVISIAFWTDIFKHIID
ncbi:hypothetical protein QTP88_017452 [Uroleucon formosanum]